MSTIKSTGLAAHLAVTGSMKAALDGGFIFIYGGTVPATADEAIANPLLMTVMVGSSGLTFESAATDGVLKKTAAETWLGTATADGTATFFRFAAADPSAASTTDKRLQGSVGTSVLDEIVFNNTALNTGDTRTLNLFQIY